jgi:hypothetical protein
MLLWAFCFHVSIINLFDTPPSSLIDPQCEYEVNIAEEQGIGACSMARSILRSRGACWSSGMGLERMTST